MKKEQEEHYLNLVRDNNLTAYHAFITAHMRMVYKLAHQYTPKRDDHRITFEELVGDGNLALCESLHQYVEKYTNNPDCKFSTFAYNRIRAALISRLRTDETVEKTEWRARCIHISNKLYDEMAEMLGRSPTYTEFEDKHGKRKADIVFMGRHDYVDTEEAMDLSEDIGVIMEELHEKIEYKRLPLSARVVLKELTNGSTLGQVTTEWNIDRQEVKNSLYDAYRQVY
jgi:RNA polymerase sigma factor (sigma-70 family)